MHTLKVEVTVTYQGEELTQAQKQAAADLAAQAAANAVEETGHTIDGSNGVIEGG